MDDHWVYWVGPFIGGALGALSYDFWFTEQQARLEHATTATALYFCICICLCPVVCMFGDHCVLVHFDFCFGV